MIRAVIDHLWQSTLFCAAIWSITLALRANSAALRHQLWLLASLKFLVPFSALYFFGVAAGLPTPVESQPPFLGAAIEVAAPVISPFVSLNSAAGGAALLVPLALVAWGLGAAWFGFAWLRDWRAADLLSRAARPAPGASSDVHVTDADVEPSVARVFRPVVLLPSALLGRLTAPQFDAVLAHEREHIARNDNLKAHLHRLVETLFWFHPLVWMVGRRLQEERELACDEAVLACGHDPGEYASGILAVCRHCAGAHQSHVAGALAGDLTARIRQILRSHPPRALGFFKALMLTLCTASVAAIPLAAGAMEGAVRRYEALATNARILRDARIDVNTSAGGDDGRVAAADNTVTIENTSLRELIALAYGVRPTQVLGGASWLDSPRYDIRAETIASVSDPDDFDPLALQPLVTKLLAARFDLEIHVNQRCQDPCGPRALETVDASP